MQCDACAVGDKDRVRLHKAVYESDAVTGLKVSIAGCQACRFATCMQDRTVLGNMWRAGFAETDLKVPGNAWLFAAAQVPTVVWLV